MRLPRVRISVKRLMIAIAALAIVLGCSIEGIRLKQRGDIRRLVLLIVALIAVLFELTYWLGLVTLSRKLGRLRKRVRVIHNSPDALGQRRGLQHLASRPFI